MNDEFFFSLEAERTSAIVAQDMEKVQRLHAPEYELVTPTGVTFSRERYLAAIEREPFYAAWEHESIRVRATQSMALVRYKAKITFPSGSIVNCWHTDSYELRGSVWQAVWSQATRLPEPQPKARE